jgi:oxygen-independent coproporphyrinogen-3 oxidase
VGGGTPTVLSDFQLASLLCNIEKKRLSSNEFTVEANPESLTVGKIKIMRDCGVNRLSIGVQSFNDIKLRKLGRIHDAVTAREKILLAHKMGFKNISIDLIFGVWGETLSVWKDDLSVATGLPVKHISAYALSYEKNTPLSRIIIQRKADRLPDTRVAAMYKIAMSFLPMYRFLQYEVSNFALEGAECRHNLNYWDNGEYLGFGPSAVSYTNGVRSRNCACLGKYIKLVNFGKSVVVSREKLSLEKSKREAAAIKIRTAAGINVDPFFQEEIDILLKRGLVRYCRGNQGICPTQKGFIFCDAISAVLV